MGDAKNKTFSLFDTGQYKRPMQVYTFDVDFKKVHGSDDADYLKLRTCVKSVALPTIKIEPIDDIHYGGYKLSIPTYNIAERILKIEFEESDDLIVTRTFMGSLKPATVINLQTANGDFIITICVYNEYVPTQKPETFKYKASLLSMSAPDLNRNGTAGACKITTEWFALPVEETVNHTEETELAEIPDEPIPVSKHKGLIVITASHLPPLAGETAAEYLTRTGGKAEPSTGQIEYNMNYEAAKKLAAKFEEEGFDVLFINDTDEYQQKAAATNNRTKKGGKKNQTHNVDEIKELKNKLIAEKTEELGYDKEQIVNIDIDHNATENHDKATGVGIITHTKSSNERGVNAEALGNGDKARDLIAEEFKKQGVKTLGKGKISDQFAKAAGTTTDVEGVGTTFDVEVGFFDNKEGVKKAQQDTDKILNAVVTGVSKHLGCED